MNNEVITLLITVILGCVGIVNTIVVTKSKVDDEVMGAKFKFALDNALKNMDAVIVQKSTLCSWVKNKKVEIAREIFAELNEIGMVTKVVRGGEIVYDITDKFAELKKKYTESEVK